MSPDDPQSPAPLLDSQGEMHLQDEAIDLSPYRFEDWLALAPFWLLGLTVFYQFFTRYALNDSAAWTEEIARYLLIGTVFVGAAVGVRKNNHIQVDFFYRVLPAKLMRVMSTLVDGVRIAFFVAGIVLTGQLIARIGGSPMAVVELPIGIVYGFVLFGFVLMAWRALGVAMANWRRGASVLERPELSDEGRQA